MKPGERKRDVNFKIFPKPKEDDVLRITRSISRDKRCESNKDVIEINNFVVNRTNIRLAYDRVDSIR